MRIIPDFETVYAEQQEPLSLLYREVEVALEQATQHYENQNLPHEPSVHASDARLYMRTGIQRSEYGFTVEDNIPNCGVYVRWPGYYVHVVKSDQGLPPVPETTSSRRFCKQRNPQQLAFRWPFSLNSDSDLDSAMDDTLDTLHLILHWLPNKEGRLRSLLLACPLDVQDNVVITKWNRVLPYPLPFPVSAAVPLEPRSARSRDLPFEPRSSETSDMDAING